MRTLKFRAWDESNKVMHHNFQFLTSGDEGNDWILFTSDEAPYEKDRKEGVVLNNPYFRQQLKVMQFTGLHDKNGLTDIYEGDIIDENSNIRGNIYETVDKRTTDLVITGMGTEAWRSTEQAAMDRGCKYAK